MKNRLILLASLLLIGAGCSGKSSAQINSFDDCARAGYPIMESYPRQCRANGTTFVEVVSQPAPRPEMDPFEPGEKPELY